MFVMYTVCQKIKTCIILNILYSCRSSAMNFSTLVLTVSANKHVDNLPSHLSYVSTLPDTTQQELSYRKQIAHQLRTEYVDGIYNNLLTSKSRLRVTQGHWKWNHWIDNTRHTVSQVI